MESVEKILQALILWKRKLLDLSKRNKALNFKSTKVTTVAIVDEQPGIVFQYLYMDGKQMRFIPILPSKNATTPDLESQDLTLFDRDDIEKEYGNAFFQPYKLEDLENKHTDNLLQCNTTPERLDISLRRLDEMLRSNIEEQGVHTLFLALGMLYYYEDDNSNEELRAPLILLPVNIERKSARTGYSITAAEDDPMVNPTLVEYLKQSYNIRLPELPDFSEESSFDLQDFFIKLIHNIKQKQRWLIKNDIYLAHFTFQKFVMFKDIEKNSEVFKDHRLVNQLVTKKETYSFWGLPQEIQQMDLDSEFPPEETFTVLDADSSQLRAIAAIAKGYDIVIEGPPGTGKSQTIVNIIALALSQNKTVLFVSEKIAALQVVQRRLKEAGLDEFCLELHSTKGNRKEVIDDLKKTIDASLSPPPQTIKISKKLRETRMQLTQYVQEVHKIIEPLGLSTFEVYGAYGELIIYESSKFEGEIRSVSKDQLDDLNTLLNEFVTLSLPLGQIKDHPWLDAHKTYYSQTSLSNIKQLASNSLALLSDFLDETGSICLKGGLETPGTFKDFDSQLTLFKIILKSPHIPWKKLKELNWQVIPKKLNKVFDNGKRYTEIIHFLKDKYSNIVFQKNYESDILYLEEMMSGFSRYFMIFKKRYRAIRKEWKSLRIEKSKTTLLQKINEIKQADESQVLKNWLDNVANEEVDLFGNDWKGSHSDWDNLKNIADWVCQFNMALVKVKFSDQTYQTASTNELTDKKVAGLSDLYDKLLDSISVLNQEVGWEKDYFSTMPVTEILSRITELNSNIDKGPQWAAFMNSFEKGKNTLAEQFMTLAYNGVLQIKDTSKIFLKSFYQAWLDKVLEENDLLKNFHSLSHNEKVLLFQQMDELIKKENRASLVNILRHSSQEKLNTPASQEGMAHLRREFAKQRRFTPLRKTIERSEATIKSMKPCFLMSPLSVAQYLKGDHPSFDLVIFDEASQLPTEDAIGAICRGEKLIVVGDPKQLPPTNFFTLQSSFINAEMDEQGQNVIEDTESVLEEFLSTNVPSARLKWHYRSTNESLISFSNHTFYDSDLYTFPSCLIIDEDSGLHFRYIPDGIYEGKGLNRKEAAAVVDEIVEHIKSNHGQSLGVGTFNMRQQLAIMDEIELRRRQDPTLEPFFDRGKVEPFFVKNLENIQGDERDVIFISVTYAKDLSGRLRYNFGPVNNENGWRRLNVLITRARKKMVVFSSIKGEDINPAITNSRGPLLIRDFLLFAEHGTIQTTTMSKLLQTESLFEKDVMQELINKGYLVDPQVGASGYRIDLGIRDESLPGKYICGIECDGVTYHSSETARDRDRLRQAVLESRGWHIIRIWSTDWFKERYNQIQRVLDYIENAKKNLHEGSLKSSNTIIEDNESGNSDSENTNSAIDSYLNGELNHYHRPANQNFIPEQPQEKHISIPESNLNTIAKAIQKIVNENAPIHWDFVFERVANMWGQRRGSRVERALHSALEIAVAVKYIRKEGNFLHKIGDYQIKIRNWEGYKLTANYIHPDERQKAILVIVDAAKMIPRERLISEVIAYMGLVRNQYSKDAIDLSIQMLINSRILGEGSAGLARKL